MILTLARRILETFSDEVKQHQKLKGKSAWYYIFFNQMFNHMPSQRVYITCARYIWIRDGKIIRLVSIHNEALQRPNVLLRRI